MLNSIVILAPASNSLSGIIMRFNMYFPMSLTQTIVHYKQPELATNIIDDNNECKSMA